MAALAQMYVRGVSTPKMKVVTEELCGHAFSASAISEINKTMDAELALPVLRAPGVREAHQRECQPHGHTVDECEGGRTGPLAPERGE